MASTTLEPALVLSDTHGIYIPQIWCEDIDKNAAEQYGINLWSLEQCQAGPDAEHYWDAWNDILDSVAVTDENGVTWRLYQNGDLWEVPDGFEWPEEF